MQIGELMLGLKNHSSYLIDVSVQPLAIIKTKMKLIRFRWDYSFQQCLSRVVHRVLIILAYFWAWTHLGTNSSVTFRRLSPRTVWVVIFMGLFVRNKQNSWMDHPDMDSMWIKLSKVKLIRVWWDYSFQQCHSWVVHGVLIISASYKTWTLMSIVMI
jgi:hypothetical protein